jgi:hypothetical protein
VAGPASKLAAERPGTPRASGSCLCGAVRFRVWGPLRDSIACHCSQCRKTSGHYWSATRAASADLELTEQRGLAWFQSSARARRGFCRECGSSLFWQPTGGSTTSIGSGTLDGPSGLRTACHIHVADKGDYFEIEPAVPQWPQDSPR